MIGELRTWIISICTAVIFITAVEMILPNDSLKKYAKFVLGLILITVLINPIIKLFDKNYDLDAYTSKAYEYFEQKEFNNNMKEYKEEGMNKTKETFKTNLEKLCESNLKQKFPNYSYKVNATVGYDEKNDSIFVKGLSVGIVNGNVESVKKVDINLKDKAVHSNNSLNDEKSRAMKDYLSNELKIPEDSIEVYKN
jgi:stage III sporulation protein AF